MFLAAYSLMVFGSRLYQRRGLSFPVSGGWAQVGTGEIGAAERGGGGGGGGGLEGGCIIWVALDPTR